MNASDRLCEISPISLQHLISPKVARGRFSFATAAFPLGVSKLNQTPEFLLRSFCHAQPSKYYADAPPLNQKFDAQRGTFNRVKG